MKRLTVAAMCVSNEDRSPVEINRCDAAPTPTGFAEIVSDDFPGFHAMDQGLLLMPHGWEAKVSLVEVNTRKNSADQQRNYYPSPTLTVVRHCEYQQRDPSRKDSA